MFNFLTQSKPEIQDGPIQPEAPAVPLNPQTIAELPQFPTSLKLTPEREKWLLEEYLLPRMEEVKYEMGLDQASNIRPGSWMAIRIQNELTYEKDLEWRRSIVGSIFAEGHNFTLGTNQRYARLLSARSRDDLLGTKPFFSAMTINEGNAQLTGEVERYVQDRIDESLVPDALRSGIRLALIRNEATMKTTYKRDATRYRGPAKVMVDGTGNPVRTPITKEYVYENDDFTEDPTTEGLVRLDKDPSFAMQRDQYGYQQFPSLPQTLVLYDGPVSQVLDPRDFLCPLKVSSVHDADINVHLFRETQANMKGPYKGYDVAARYFDDRSVGETGVDQPRRGQGEEEEYPSRVLAKRLYGEFYARVDADNDGDPEEIFAVIDIQAKKFVFYDYTGNHMSRRPFDVITGIERVPDRWYGVGVFTKMEHSALYIDAQFNRINHKDSKDSSATFAKREGVRQWRDGDKIALGTDDILEALPGYDKNNPPLWRVNLQEDAQLGTEMMAKMTQAADQEFGVISASDASASDLNQSKTATGIMSIDRDASVMTKDTEYDQTKGIVGVLDLTIELLLEHMPDNQIQFSKDFKTLVTLNKDEIRGLKRKVQLLLTKSKSTQQLQMNEKAEAVWLRYMRLDPREQFYGRDFYIKQLKSLEVDDADDRLPKVTWEDVQAWQKQQADAAKAQTQPPSKSISTKLTDLAPSERDQVLQSEGITPAPPEELQAKQQRDLATKVAEREAGKQQPQANAPK